MPTTSDSYLFKVGNKDVVKAMAESVQRGTDGSAGFTPVIARFDDNAQISFEIERTPAGEVVVYLPGAPNPWSGSIVLLDSERVQKLDVSVSDAIRSIQALGRGSGGLSQSGSHT